MMKANMMSKSTERLHKSNYMRKPNAKSLKDPMKFTESYQSNPMHVKSSRHFKSKSNHAFKPKSEQSK